jgi:hypothetical protein
MLPYDALHGCSVRCCCQGCSSVHTLRRLHVASLRTAGQIIEVQEWACWIQRLIPAHVSSCCV